MDGRTWAVVDLDKLKSNVKALKERLSSYQTINKSNSKVRILAAVKAAAYGHGAREISKTLKEEGIDMLGVASIDEACELAEIGLPIVILSPILVSDVPKLTRLPKQSSPLRRSESEASGQVSNDFIPTVTYYPFAIELNKRAKEAGKIIKINIEVDTGMGRTGTPYTEAIDFILKVLELKNLKLDGLFTHFAETERPARHPAGGGDKNFTLNQLEKFNALIQELQNKGIQVPLVHTANSAAILGFPDSYFNMIRPGLLLYGLYPSVHTSSIEVKPILNLYTRVCQLKLVPPGTPISYGRTYITNESSKIATLSVGYGDGYPRSLSNKGIVVIKSKRAKVVGAVCMDLTMVDVTHIPDVKIGDKVTLIGNGISCDEVAKLAGTISYEILTNICPRVPRIYINNGKPCGVKSLLIDTTKNEFPHHTVRDARCSKSTSRVDKNGRQEV
ncbi:alanine racemase [candidate division WOR-3 bacterium]|nr:alanine racemase [candidate division WOR-3 bacterium]